MRCFAVMAGLGLLAAAAPAAAQPLPAWLKPCHVDGVDHQVACGVLKRPLDPAAPQGVQIDLHVTVLPALARNKKPDPVFFFAGGPGQSAIALAGPVAQLTRRLGNRRDVVLIDQRGTGKSAPLSCPEPPQTTPLAEATGVAQQIKAAARCLSVLQSLPHGDLRHYTTTVAMQDVDAVRQALGAERINLMGGSYGTRAALEYQRQFPKAVRRAVLDGLAPPDMVLPEAFSSDSQAALDAMFNACEAQAPCRDRHPRLRAQWRELLEGAPRAMSAQHPATGEREMLQVDREMLLSLVRAPLYGPALAAGLPEAIARAAGGDLTPLVGLAGALGGNRRSLQLAMGMHFTVVCAEDGPRIGSGAGGAPSPEFGAMYANLYRQVCASWPRGTVPAAFYDIPTAQTPVLLLSGGADPATPPRHGERTKQRLGAKAAHVVVREAGHGTLSLACLRETIFRFIDEEDEAAALALRAECADKLPRPLAWLPPRASAPAASGAQR